VSIILGAYMLSVLSGMDERLDFLKWLTPFRYYDAGDLYRSGTLEGGYLLLSGLIVLVCVAGAYWAYNRRDLYI